MWRTHSCVPRRDSSRCQRVTISTMKASWAGVLFSIAPLLGQSYPAATTAFSNIFGGKSGTDAATALAVDPNGNVAVLGTTSSPDFPVTHAYLPTVPNPPLLAISPNAWTHPNLGPAVDVLAMASTIDGSVVYAASNSGLFRSADGGATWTQQLPGIAGANTLAVDGADPNTVYTPSPTTPSIPLLARSRAPMADRTGRQSPASSFFRSASRPHCAAPRNSPQPSTPPTTVFTVAAMGATPGPSSARITTTSTPSPSHPPTRTSSTPSPPTDSFTAAPTEATPGPRPALCSRPT